MAGEGEPRGVDEAGKGGAQSARPPGYREEDLRGVPQGAIEMSWGCGNPTALAELREGQVVLDLGCGAGLDAFVAARKVGPNGKVIGVDMTPEMVAKATRFAREGGCRNVEFRLGRLELLPLADESVDVIVSNCVINHCPDKAAAFAEARRVLRPDGRMFVSDLVVEGRVPPPDTPGLEVWAEWLKAACGKRPYLDAIGRAGFQDVEVLAERVYDGPALAESLAGKIVSLELRACKRART
jgi:ubiquinone/menaquinone biosynthesis C-methylase UbiE